MNITSIEGNIGSGKTTLLSAMKEHFKDNKNIVFIKEPVDEWMAIKDKEGKNIIEKYYADQSKYAFSFQMLAFISKVKLLEDAYIANPNAIFISERSLYTDKYVFAKMLYDTDKIEDVNYAIYLKWFNHFIDFPNRITLNNGNSNNEQQQQQPKQSSHKVVYVDTTPETCYERIHSRNRGGEELIPMDYLKSCDDYHKAMITNDEIYCLGESTDYLMVVDGSINYLEEKEQLDKVLDSLSDFVLS